MVCLISFRSFFLGMSGRLPHDSMRCFNCRPSVLPYKRFSLWKSSAKSSFVLLMAKPAVMILGEKELLKNYEMVKEDCKKFLDNLVSDDKNGTRTKRHCSMIMLTEFLYRKYLCNGSEDLSGRRALEEALDNQYNIQQEELQRLSIHEQQDYVEEVMNMLESNNRYIQVITNPDRYIDYTTTCCQKGDTIYITRQALCYGMMKYCQRRVNINTIIRAFETEGILHNVFCP